MGFIGKLIKTGVAAGVAYAAVKVNEKYKANNPYGVEDSKEKADAIKQAAGEVYQEVSELAKEKMPGIKENAANLAQQGFSKVKEYAPGVMEKIQSAATVVSEKAQEFADSLNSEAIDADFVPVDENEEKNEDNI